MIKTPDGFLDGDCHGYSVRLPWDDASSSMAPGRQTVRRFDKCGAAA
jgi:hypothetical protein